MLLLLLSTMNMARERVSNFAPTFVWVEQEKKKENFNQPISLLIPLIDL